jgi:hypothetical protein
MAERRPGGDRKPASEAPSARVGMLNKLGNAHWGVACGMGVVLLGVGFYTGEIFAQVYGAVMVVLGLVLAYVRRKR